MSRLLSNIIEALVVILIGIIVIPIMLLGCLSFLILGLVLLVIDVFEE